MADNTIESRGTEVFISTDGTTVGKLVCPTGVSGGGVTVNTQEIDCLDASSAYDRPIGRKNKPINVPFVYQSGDTVHKFVLSLINSATLTTTETPYCIAFSDGSADPTITAGAFVPAASRTQISGKCYITDVSIDVAQGDVIRGSLVITPITTVVTHKA